MWFEHLACCLHISISKTKYGLLLKALKKMVHNADLDPFVIEFAISKYFVDRSNRISAGRSLLLVNEVIPNQGSSKGFKEGL
jgi:hypothetical protein